MNAEAEFNALVSMYQSVIQDIKITYPAWENVCQKAHKLSTQLKSTLACINSFVDAVQVVGDAANNLKGSTRDIGACLTRFCMRQRSLENRLRSLADALTDELAMSIQSKCSQWKQKINEMDRHSAKFCKRVRSRKGAIDISTVNEQRRLCRHLLTEQRSQLSFFISALLPCLNSQLNLMDEGGHVRQVAEHLQSTVRSVDTASLIDTILSDLHHGADYAWRNCLSSNTQRDFMQTSFKAESFAIRASSPCPSNATWPTVSEGCLPGMSKSTPSTFPTNTVSSSSSEVGRRLAITQKTFIPLSPCRFPLTKPPLPRKVVSASSPVPTVIPDFNNVHSDQMPVSGCSSGSQYSSVTDVSRENSVRRTKRPLSFACDDTVVAPHSSYSSGSSSNLHSDYASFPHSHDRGPLIRDQYNASLIAETLQQIDNLGIELDSYCRAAPSTLTHQTIRFRSGSCKPPPPPERRNSTITAATSSAPSVAVMRAAGNTVSDQASKTTSVETRCIDQ